MKRLDVLVSKKYAISRSFSSSLIKKGKVQFRGDALLEPDKKLSELSVDQIYISDDDLVREEVPTWIEAEEIPFHCLYEDAHVLVIDKEIGMSVHTSASEHHHTVLNGLIWRYIDLEERFKGFRPGIVHRLDKQTSGVLIIAKDRPTQEMLASQFKNREVYKEYWAIVTGVIDIDVTIDKAISRNKADRKKMGIYDNGRSALTFVYPQGIYSDQKEKYTLLKLVPKTGRTHQLRVHLKSIGHPIIGDTIYGGKSYERLMLQAKILRIRIPEKGEMEFISQLDPSFDAFLAPLHHTALDEKTKSKAGTF